MKLQELIDALSAEDPNKVIRNGFDNPHSYRGYYQDLAFEPAGPRRVGDILEMAKRCVGKTFQGYKGGYYGMGPYTDVWIAEYGTTKGAAYLSHLLLGYILKDTVEDEP